MIDFADAVSVVSVSGGKDSTATLLLTLEWEIPNCRYVFADTGNESLHTVEYIQYLQAKLGIEIQTVKADLSQRVLDKHTLVRSKWVNEGAVTADEAEAICELLVPSGNPFLDLCMWKGRFPSRRSQFCTTELKTIPITEQVNQPLLDAGHEVISWQGVRREESEARANAALWEESGEIYICRPLVYSAVSDVFRIHRRWNISPNPLYSQGMNRVGCMPCINVAKMELREIAARFPDEVARIAAWERIVSLVSKQKCATFFAAGTDPVIATSNNAEISLLTHGIYQIVEWSKTQRGGRYFDWISEQPSSTVCKSSYGLCE